MNVLRNIRLAAAAALAAAALCTPAAADAQNIDAFRRRLNTPVQGDSHFEPATVRISEQGDVAAVTRAAERRSPQTVQGYRIVVFMSNAQSARAEAFAARDAFASRFPDEKCYVTYENLYFKVTAGNCAAEEDALVLLHRVSGEFPKAFKTRENIPVAEFTTPRPAPADEPEL